MVEMVDMNCSLILILKLRHSEYLNSMVRVISYDDVAFLIDRYSDWIVELTIS